MFQSTVINSGFHMTRHIGHTTYKVKAVFSKVSAQTLEDRMLHLIQNEILAADTKRGKMELPQMSRQPERSA